MSLVDPLDPQRAFFLVVTRSSRATLGNG